VTRHGGVRCNAEETRSPPRRQCRAPRQRVRAPPGRCSDYAPRSRCAWCPAPMTERRALSTLSTLSTQRVQRAWQRTQCDGCSHDSITSCLCAHEPAALSSVAGTAWYLKNSRRRLWFAIGPVALCITLAIQRRRWIPAGYSHEQPCMAYR
jgi:hypothetical protein